MMRKKFLYHFSCDLAGQFFLSQKRTGPNFLKIYSKFNKLKFSNFELFIDTIVEILLLISTRFGR